jgi:Arc/MetJ-type ribon-helix-helix transcriptional regulator
MTDKLSERVHLNLTFEEAQYIDRMVVDGGFSSRSALIRSILREIIRDEFGESAAKVRAA